jgi:N-acetylmuramoyl-L-alanine amidase CwlA
MAIQKLLIQNNYTNGRFGYSIKRIVLHTYGGGGRSLFNWFNAPTTQASAHYAIFKDGNGEQYVEDGNMAWHAGTVAGGGLPNNNWESIGIEHQDDGNPGDSVRTNELYEASAQLVADLCRRHGVPCRLLSEGQKWSSGIALHNYYANKSCPGGLNAQRIVNRANEILNPAPPLDDFYRVIKNGVQIGAFKDKDNAFNTWYTDKSQRVTFKNNDITQDFKNMATQLEAQINELKTKNEALDKQVVKLSYDRDAAIMERDGFKKQADELSLSNIELKSQRDAAVTERDRFLKSFFGQLYLLFSKNSGRTT